MIIDNTAKTLVIIPTYGCNNHCQYCMYRDLTFSKTVATVDQLIANVKQLTNRYTFNGFAIGGGGDILNLGYDYCTSLITQLESIVAGDQIMLLTNVHTIEDVHYLDQLALHHNIQLNISLNDERPHNETTIQLLKSFNPNTLNKTCISIVVFKSVIERGVKETLDFINTLGVRGVLFNQYEQTPSANIQYYPNDIQYFQFLKDCMLYWGASRQRYNFVLPQVFDLVLCNDMCGFVDVIVDPWGIKIAQFDKQRRRCLKPITNIDKLNKHIKTTMCDIIDKRCLMCADLSVCEHKYTQQCLNPQVCDIVRQMSEYAKQLYGY